MAMMMAAHGTLCYFPQVDCNPISGFPLPDKSLWDNRSTSPGERSVQSGRSTGPNRTGLDRTGPVPPNTDLLMMQRTLVRYRLSTFSHRTEPNRTERIVSTALPTMSGTDRSETQVLEVSDVNSDRTELGDLEELDKRPNRTDSHSLNYRTNRSKYRYGSDSSGHLTASSRHRSARDRYDRSHHSPRLAIEENRHSRSIIPLRHAELGELSPASRLKQRRQRSSSDYSASPSRSRSPSRPRRKSKKKSHKKKKRKRSPLSYSSSSCRSSSSSRERRKHRH